LTISLSAQVGTRSFEAHQIAQSADRQLASGFRVHPALDQLAGSHLDVKGDFLVDFLIERNPPQP